MNKLGRFAIGLVALATLAFAGTAIAGSKTIAQTGQITGDKSAAVKLRVKVKNGTAVKVSGFKATNVLTRCDGEVVRFKYTALDPLPVINKEFKVKLTGTPDAVLTIQGKVKKNGKATIGSLKTNKFTGTGGETCKTPKQRFKTSK